MKFGVDNVHRQWNCLQMIYCSLYCMQYTICGIKKCIPFPHAAKLSVLGYDDRERSTWHLPTCSYIANAQRKK